MEKRKTIGQEVAAKLKAIGITNKQVSCRSDYSAIRCSVKDLSIDLEVVKSIAMDYQKINYCEYSGDILSGGNLFVFVDYDWQVEAATRKSDKFLQLLNTITDKLAQLEDSQCADLFGAITYKHPEGCLVLKWDSNNETKHERHHNLGNLAWSVYVKLANGTFKEA